MSGQRNAMIREITAMSARIRQHAIKMTLNAGDQGGHIGPGLSIVDIVTTLYFGVMKIDPKNPSWADRDRFVLSKGHGVLGYYPVLTEAGYFSRDIVFLRNFCVTRANHEAIA